MPSSVEPISGLACNLNGHCSAISSGRTRFEFVIVSTRRRPCQGVRWRDANVKAMRIVEILIDVNDGRLLNIGVDVEVKLKARCVWIEYHRRR